MVRVPYGRVGREPEVDGYHRQAPNTFPDYFSQVLEAGGRPLLVIISAFRYVFRGVLVMPS